MGTLRRRVKLREALVGVGIALFTLTVASADEPAGKSPAEKQAEEKQQTKGDAVTVTDGKRISIEYTLTLSDKTQFDTNVGREPLTYTQGSQEILPTLQKALVGLKVGETKQVTLSPQDGY